MKSTKTVLLVEDDMDDQEFFASALSRIGNVRLIAIANSGEEALKKMKEATTLPDLIFMDVEMPMMSGIECLANILSNPLTKHIPVVMLSTARDRRVQAMELGARGFIEKPTTMKRMDFELERAVNLDFGPSAG